MHIYNRYSQRSKAKIAKEYVLQTVNLVLTLKPRKTNQDVEKHYLQNRTKLIARL